MFDYIAPVQRRRKAVRNGSSSKLSLVAIQTKSGRSSFIDEVMEYDSLLDPLVDDEEFEDKTLETLLGRSSSRPAMSDDWGDLFD